MPTVEDYVALAPFTIDELVSAVNSILRDRPSRQIQTRTVRYYISQGLIAPPSGGPKFARYSEEHLRSLVLIRQLLDEGLSLDQVRRKLGLPSDPAVPSEDLRTRRSSPRPEAVSGRTKPLAVSQKSFLQLDASIRLEFDSHLSTEAALALARKRIDELLDDSV